jgi:hypothetical protein
MLYVVFQGLRERVKGMFARPAKDAAAH